MKNFIPDGYSPEQAVIKLAEVVYDNFNRKNDYYALTYRDDGRNGAHAYHNWKISMYEEYIKPKEILYPKDFESNGLIFQEVRIPSPIDANDGQHKDIKVREINFVKKVPEFPYPIQDELEKIKQHYVNYGLVEKKEDVNFVIASTDDKGSRYGEAQIFVTLPAHKLSFKKVLKLKEQFANHDVVEKLLGEVLDKNIEEKYGTIQKVEPESPSSPMFTRLLLDTEHYEIFSKLKNVEHYTINQSAEEGDYPPQSWWRWALNLDNVNLTIMTEDNKLISTNEKSYTDKATPKQVSAIKGAFNKLAGLQDGVSVVEVILDGRELNKLKEDLLALKAERALDDLISANPDRAKELLRDFNKRGGGERLK